MLVQCRSCLIKCFGFAEHWGLRLHWSCYQPDVSFPLLDGPSSAELSGSLRVWDRGRNAKKPVRNRSESVCAGSWAPPWAFWDSLFPVWEPIWAPKHQFSAGFVEAFGALFAQPIRFKAPVGGNSRGPASSEGRAMTSWVLMSLPSTIPNAPRIGPGAQAHYPYVQGP